MFFLQIDIETFCLTFAITAAHFRGEWQHVAHLGEQKNKYRPIRTREIMISNC